MVNRSFNQINVTKKQILLIIFIAKSLDEKISFCVWARGNYLGIWVLPKKKVILDKSQCCGGLVLDWVPLTAT